MTVQALVLALLSSVVLVLAGLTTSPARWSVKHLVTEPKRTVSELFTVLSTSDIARLKPFTFYASAAYCQPSQILAWGCGQNCIANPNFRPVAAGGDGATAQYWYVGYDPTLTSIIVSHQGTDPEKILPLFTDAEVEQIKLDPRLFPALPSSIRVHSGFADELAKTADDILKAVQTTIQQYGITNVTVVGHSLGAALALLDGISLPLRIPGLSIQMIGYGMPRVGNRAFASYVDGTVSVTHVTNKKDPVPIIPGRFMGYHHPRGEIHIQTAGSWVSCPGDDNNDKRCSVGDVPDISQGNLNDHDGPYGGVVIRCE